MWEHFRNFYARHTRRPLRVWFDSAYRLPLTGVEERTGIDSRRAEDALQFLLHSRAVDATALGRPHAISYAELGLVHSAEYLESLSNPRVLADIFAVDVSDVVPDELIRTYRLGCGGTLAAARDALKEARPNLNLFGGFHHARPDRGVGFCPLNDVVVAVRVLRREGLKGTVAVLDLDAHPPDGTAACLRPEDNVWVGSLSGVDWAPPRSVHETVLPQGCDDKRYLAELDTLLGKMPKAALTFVLAGGDVLAHDRLGALGLTLEGARTRDLNVLKALGGRPSVWLPAGGYGSNAWKALAGTGLALALGSEAPIPAEYDPLSQRFHFIAKGLSAEDLGSAGTLSESDFPELYGPSQAAQHRLLGFYTAEGIELAWEKFGLLDVLRRLGYRDLRVELGQRGKADQTRLLGVDVDTGEEHPLVELAVEKKTIGTREFLFINWLSLRHPRAKFSDKRPQLPGQEVPGLGLAREAALMTGLVAGRLGFDGVAFCPSWYHMAFAARHTSRFFNAERQGRFEALVRDTAAIPLLEVTNAVAQGRVRLNGQPYQWEPDEMIRWLDKAQIPEDRERVAAERESSRFTVVSAA
ncbi:MAG: histone deacetylase [Myxococcaceae bacterium]|nr:histone deacetylase [Myxococcaceae bacterium]